MSGVKKFEHATLRVVDLEDALEFYRDVLGLVELDRRDGVTYLGCGYDENYDLGLTEGKTGVEHFAIRVADGDELSRYEGRLDDAGIEYERTDGAEPGQAEGLRFTLPTGVDMEFVTVEDADYHHPTRTHEERARVAPRDVDHANLMSWDVDRDLDVLTETLGAEVSDKIVGETGFTIQAWARFGDLHHDVGISTADNVEYSLHHLSFEVEGFEHIKALCDRIAASGHEIELGPSRHNAGANNFAYLWSPGGNRIELTAEMATVDEAAETGVREISRESNTVSSWGGVEPTPSFLENGS